MGLFDLGNSLDGDNHASPIGALGSKFQKWIDPIAWLPGGLGNDWVNLTSNKIPELTNSGLSKVIHPFDEIDQTINPVRRYVPGVNEVADWVGNKPGDTIGIVAGSVFGGGEALGALGAGGLGSAGAAGAGSAAGDLGAGALGAGAGDAAAAGGVADTSGAGLLSLGTDGLGSAPTGLFSGLAPGGGLTGADALGGGYAGTSASSALPIFSMDGSGAVGSLGVGNSAPSFLQQFGHNIATSKQPAQQPLPQAQLGSANDEGPMATITAFNPAQTIPTVNTHLLGQALAGYR